VPSDPVCDSWWCSAWSWLCSSAAMANILQMMMIYLSVWQLCL
jgi:hypothetical protein